MATKAREYVNFTLTEAVSTAFMSIIAPVQFKENGKPKGDPRYSGTFVFAPESADLKNLKALIVEHLKKEFPGKTLVPRRLTEEQLASGNCVEIKLPWSDGTKLAEEGKVPDAAGKTRDNEWARGKVLVKTGSDDKHPPGVSGIENGKVVDYSDPAVRASKGALFYSGAYVIAQFGLNIYPAKGEKPGGCSLWPRAVCFVKHGPKTTGGGGVNQAEVFRSYVGKATSQNPIEGIDDEIPF